MPKLIDYGNPAETLKPKVYNPHDYIPRSQHFLEALMKDVVPAYNSLSDLKKELATAVGKKATEEELKDRVEAHVSILYAETLIINEFFY